MIEISDFDIILLSFSSEEIKKYYFNMYRKSVKLFHINYSLTGREVFTGKSQTDLAVFTER